MPDKDATALGEPVAEAEPDRLAVALAVSVAVAVAVEEPVAAALAEALLVGVSLA